MWPFNKPKEKLSKSQLQKGDWVTSDLKLFHGKEMVLKVRKVITRGGFQYDEGDAITVSNFNGEVWSKYLTKC